MTKKVIGNCMGADGSMVPRSAIKVRAKPAHVLLMERDLELMVALHDHVVLGFAQIHEGFFHGRTWATAMNRLKRLESKGWIERIRVPRLHIQGRSHAAGVVFQLRHLGRMIVASRRPDIDIYDKCPQLNPNQLSHDLLIADISEYFKHRFPEHRWTNGRYLIAGDGLNKIPDAVLQKPSADKLVAIELELTGKSARRYSEIVAVLRASRRIERVIFVTSNFTIGRKIMSAIEGFEVPVGHKLRSNFFEFVRLSECIKARK